MMPFSRLFRSSVATAVLLPALLAGCAQNSEPTQFAPLRYDYLGQMNLNVSSLAIVDRTAAHPVEGNIGLESPTPPLQAIRQMAQDRLSARGATDSTNTARFVIDRASILHLPGGTLKGNVGVHLDILAADGHRVASASAQASQSLHPDPSGNVESRANLYAVTRDMMQTLNVEFEYQVHHSLSKWLVDAGGTPMNNAIQTQPLTGAPDATAPVPSAAAASTPAADTMSDTKRLTELPSAGTTPANVSVDSASTDTASSAAQSSTPAQAQAQAQAAPQESEPSAIFPAGTDDTPAPAKTLSPKAGFLTLPANKKTR